MGESLDTGKLSVCLSVCHPNSPAGEGLRCLKEKPAAPFLQPPVERVYLMGMGIMRKEISAEEKGKRAQQEQCNENGLRDLSAKLPETAGMLKRRGEL